MRRIVISSHDYLVRATRNADGTKYINHSVCKFPAKGRLQLCRYWSQMMSFRKGQRPIIIFFAIRPLEIEQPTTYFPSTENGVFYQPTDWIGGIIVPFIR